MAGEVSYFSRFTVKFVEIVAAGMATAISGYLIAHVSGFMSSPAPAPVVGVPSASAVSAQPVAPSQPIQAASPAPPAQVTPAGQPVQVTQPSQPVSPTPPVAAEASEPRSPPAQETTPAKAPVRTTVKIKSREPADKAHEAAENKPRDWESVEARVRAALANAANRPPAPETPPAQADTTQSSPDVAIQSPPAVAVQPRPGDEPSTTGTVAGPRVANPLPQQAAAAPEAPTRPDPLPAVEIRSRPVADVEAVPPPAPAAPAEASNQSETPDLVSAIKKLPEILRNDKPVPAAEAPRPPMPVGQ